MINGKIRVAQIIGRVCNGGVEAMINSIFEHIDHNQVTFDFFVESTSLIINRERIEKLGGRIIEIPSYKSLFKFKKALKTNFENNNYDIVHSNLNTLSFIVLKVAKKCGIQVRIAHAHSTTNKKEKIRHLIKNILKHKSKKYATHYFACSEKAGRWQFSDKTFNEGKVQIIDNAIDVNKFSFNLNKRSQIRYLLNIKENEQIIGHIGRFDLQKNHDFLLDVFKCLQKSNKNIRLLLIGDGDLKPLIENRVQKEHISGVIFTGCVSNTSDYYNAMDCFVLTSLYEGLPVVGVEAQANGLKCFFSDQVTPEAKLIDTTEFIALSDSCEVWANRLKDYFLDSKRSNQPIPNCYNIDFIANKVLQLYKSFLSNKQKD